MTRKDFEAIAEEIRKHGIARENPSFIVDLLIVFKRSNPLFDTVRFLKACRDE